MMLRALVCVALLMAHAAVAQQPELDGTWFPARFAAGGPSAPDQELLRMAAPTATLMRDAPPPVFELPAGDFGGLQLQPAALELAARWRPDAEPNLATACSPASIVEAMTSPFPFELHLGTELVVLKLEYFDLVRIVFMDGRGHPAPDYPHSKVGHSIGRWEGDVLVVDTTHLSPSRITSNGLDHTQDMHVIERFKLAPDGALHWTQELADPAVLRVSGLRYAALRRQNAAVAPYECDPSYAASILRREQ